MIGIREADIKKQIKKALRSKINNAIRAELDVAKLVTNYWSSVTSAISNVFEKQDEVEDNGKILKDAIDFDSEKMRELDDINRKFAELVRLSKEITQEIAVFSDDFDGAAPF